MTGLVFLVATAAVIPLFMIVLRRLYPDGMNPLQLRGLALFWVGAIVTDGSRLIAWQFSDEAVIVGSLVTAVGYVMIVAAIHPSWREVVLDAWLIGVCAVGAGYDIVLLFTPIDTSLTALADGLAMVVAVWSFQLYVAIGLCLHTSSTFDRRLYVFLGGLRAFTWTLFALQSGLGWDEVGPVARALLLVSYLLGTILELRLLRSGPHHDRPPTPIRRPAQLPYLVFGGAAAISMVCFVVNPRALHPVLMAISTISILMLVLRQLATLRTYRELTEEVAVRERYYRGLVQDSSDVIMLCSLGGALEYASPAAQRVLGVQPANGHRLARVLGLPEDTVESAIGTLSNVGDRMRLEGRRGGQVVEVDLTRRDDGLIASIRDVSERDLLRRNLFYLAYHDALTGLANRSSVLGQVDDALSHGIPAGYCVLFIDLDRFKQVNDAHGHALGDAVLREVAGRLRAQVGELPLGRIGGDEFLVTTREGQTEAEHLAGRIRAALSEPFVLSDRTFQLGASIGIANPVGDVDAAELIRRADLAMYRAKRDHLGWAVYEPTMGSQAVTRADVDAQAGRAIRERRMIVFFQPIMDLDTGRVRSVESLLRWQDDAGHVRAPAELLDFARRSGQLVDVCEWVLATALGHLGDSGSAISVAVNLPPAALLAPGMLPTLQRLLRQNGVTPGQLEIEVTEDELFDQAPSAVRVMEQLRELGVRVVIDDFGTGFSSLSYLVDLPISGLKIDRRFIAALDGSSTVRAVVGGVMQVAEELGLSVVAEGVETADQHRWATLLGLTLGQGFWYARPEPAASLADLGLVSSWVSGISWAQDVPEPRFGDLRPRDEHS